MADATDLPDKEVFLSEGFAFPKVSTLAADEIACAICQEELHKITDISAGTERPVLIHSKHLLGESCIRSWLEEHNSCPVCRQILFAEPETWEPPEHLEYFRERVELVRRRMRAKDMIALADDDDLVLTIRTYIHYYNVSSDEGDDDLCQYLAEALLDAMRLRLELFESGLRTSNIYEHHFFLPAPEPVTLEAETMQKRTCADELRRALFEYMLSHAREPSHEGLRTVALHPKVLVAFNLVSMALQERDGELRTVVQLKRHLKDRVSGSTEFGAFFDAQGRPVQEMQLFFSFARDLIEAVVGAHAAMEEDEEEDERED